MSTTDVTLCGGFVNLLTILSDPWHNHPDDEPSRIKRTAEYRQEMRQRCASWAEITGTERAA
jgi:hypothetical protein